MNRGGLRGEIEEKFLHCASRLVRRSERGEKTSARFGRNDKCFGGGSVAQDRVMNRGGLRGRLQADLPAQRLVGVSALKPAPCKKLRVQRPARFDRNGWFCLSCIF
jgi:hypothetical protein